MQDTSETAVALGGCKTEKTSGDLGWRGKQKRERWYLPEGSGLQGCETPLKAAQERSPPAASGRKKAAPGFPREWHINVYAIPSGSDHLTC